MFEIFLYYFKFSGITLFLFPFIGLLITFFSGYFSYYFLSLIFARKPSSHYFNLFIKRFIITLATILVFCTFLGFMVEIITLHATTSKIAFFSSAFLELDKVLFGNYVPFWFGNTSNSLKTFFDMLAPLIINCYRWLGSLLGLLFFTLFVIKPNQFYRASLSFAIMILISMPMWFLFPAVSPLDAYINHVVPIVTSEDFQAALSMYHPNKSLSLYLDYISSLTKEYKDQFFAITEMPSMHIAWSVLILYFGFKIWRPLLFFLIPYFLLNAVGTLYTLQHYTIDLPAGLLVAIISIWMAEMVAKYITPKIFVSQGLELVR